MSHYDFSTLSPHDFELLTRDLLQAEWKLHLESFKSGRDKGIDLRYSKPQGTSREIIQCKHYRGTGFGGLKRTILNDELPKILKLNPTKYVLSTSVSLSPQDKDQLCSILTPYCVASGDIFGADDLNNLLGKYPQIERRHFKLWLPSTGVLTRLLNNGVFTQSALEIDDIKRQLSLFVPTDAVGRGLSMLDEYGFCMLTGIPGIGKTTTARILVAHHVEKDWEGIYISGHAKEALEVFQPKEKQIFYYDDFLGQTSLDEKLMKNEDYLLVQLIAACQKHPGSKRLILTTREHLFEQANSRYEVLYRSSIGQGRCIVRLADYNRRIRAEILVNHLYFYGIDPEVCSGFVKNGAAKKTLGHRNYNPRIVETICKMQKAFKYDAAQFASEFFKKLDSPAEIWRSAYCEQLSSSAQQLLLTFAILGNNVTLDALKGQFEIYSQVVGANMIGYNRRFEACIKELDGMFLAVYSNPQRTYIAYHNPSIKDFTDSELEREPHFLRTVVAHLTYDTTLLNAVKILLKVTPDQVSASDVVSFCKKGDYKTAYHVSPYSGNYSMTKQERFYTLMEWLDVCVELKNIEAIKQVLDISCDFIRNTDPSFYSVTCFSDLYDKCKQVANLRKINLSLTAVELFFHLLEQCGRPDDCISLHELIGENPCEELRCKLIDKLSEGGGKWLNSVVRDATTSEEIVNAVDVLKEAVAKFDISLKAFDLSEAEARADELAGYEDAKADFEFEQWRDDRVEDLLEEREIDDILGSLDN